MSAAAAPDPGHDAAGADVLLGVLVRHARALADLGPVRLAVGSVSVEIGDGTGVAPQAPALAVVPEPAPVVAPTGVPTEEPAADPRPVGVEITSATVGVFYRASEPGAAPFVTEGDPVAVGQQVAIVEAMKLMIPLESDRAGRVIEFLVADGEAVEHGQPVLRLDPS